MYTIVRSEIKQVHCLRCCKPKYCVRVINNLTGEEEWRCNNCVRRLKNSGREIAHYDLTPREMQKLKKSITP
jgi:ubiquitin C-terminal hydrolase